MVTFSRQSSGVYLADLPATARVAFLYTDPQKTDPTFELTQASWLALNSAGYFAFFEPSATRDWAAFAAQVRNVFGDPSNAQTQFGWFADASQVPPVLIAVDWSSGQPVVAQPFALAFRQSVTLTVQPSLMGGDPTIGFDDSSAAFRLNDTSGTQQIFVLTATPPSGGSTSYFSPGTYAALPVTGDLAGTLSVPFALGVNDLTQFEAGMMYFDPPEAGSLIKALSYPLFRSAGASGAAFTFDVTLDVLAPLDPLRTYFQFTDAVLGSNYTTATGKPVYFRSVGDSVAQASRFVFANRPVQTPGDTGYYYLTPAGQFAMSLTDGSQIAENAQDGATRLLCGITGTEFLDIAVGATPDRLEFVPAQPAYRIPPTAGAQSAPVYLAADATTSYARIVTNAGAYVSQPQGAPLFAQPDSGPAKLGDGEPASGLSVHVLDFLPIESWTPAQEAPATPLVPYGGLNFATDPNLKVADYTDMESNALNPTRADAYLTAKASGSSFHRPLHAALGETGETMAMTPQGMLAGIAGTPPAWTELQMAISDAGILRFDPMGPAIRKAVQQNQIFTVISTDPGQLFGFDDSAVTIGDWTFDLSPGGLKSPDGTPPIFMMKFYPGESIEDLVADRRLWSQPDTFNTAPFDSECAQKYLQDVIAAAKADVFPDGATAPDTSSLYWNFYETVTDPAFSGILVVNCNMQLEKLPGAIRAILGGMKDPGIAGFRVHHVGISINNTDPAVAKPTLAQSATFALVDYEKTKTEGDGRALALNIDYDFEVEYLRALFTNSELRTFACQLDLTINSLFDTGVNQDSADKGETADDAGNTITIMGSYQAHSTSGNDSSSGEGLYSFVTQGEFVFDFTDKDGKANNNYLKKITLTKLQFSFDDESAGSGSPGTGITTHITSHFGIWGNIEFNELKVLDIFSFEKLEFSDLGIDVGFDLTIYEASSGKQPKTDNLELGFSPGNLRLDLGATEKRAGDNSLLSLIPFKLQSFLYATGDGQSIEDLDFYSLGAVAGLSDNGITLQDKFNYGLIFELDLGSMGGLVGSLSAFKFSMLIGWQNPLKGGGIAFGVQLPQVDGKLEIKIQGVLTISIEQFTLLYATDSDPKMLVLGLQDCFVEVLGTRLPPRGTVSLGLFAPSEGADQIGWIGAYNLGEDGGGGEGGGGEGGGRAVARGGSRRIALAEAEDGSEVLKLTYVGLGQRVGPDPTDPPTDFASFLEYMQTTFWEKLKDKEFSEIYHPDGRWIFVVDFTLLGLIEIGAVFYDVTPFYALQVSLVGGAGKGFSFEITYTKVTDTIGLYATTISLPDKLRTFQVGVASVTLPTLSINIYTNGDWKVDLGFPNGDDWSACFQVQAQAGPVPVTGSGGFYIASLSSATDPDVFKGTYQSINAFGFAIRLGVGKDFVAGPLKAGVSVTFFGIIQGAAGYLTSGGGDIFRTPDALSLQGQIGIIGELYGSLDFVIIKASVNVRLQASIGLILTYEPKAPGGGDGSILLYIEASVSVSVSVEINFFLFSVTISFSFDASFRFEWQLVGSSQEKLAFLQDYRSARRLAAAHAVGLCPGLSATLPLLYLPEATVVFPDATNSGVPWIAVSLGVEYEPAPQADPPYSAFKPFEVVTTQLATFALMHALDLATYDAVVTLEDSGGKPGLRSIDSDPDLLTGWMNYADVLGQLGNFAATVAQPTQETQATVFPMPPFLQLATQGRTDGKNASDLSYTFQSKNAVSKKYLLQVDAYFNQLFVNQTPTPPTLRSEADTLTPLTTEIFLDYFRGLVRGAVHQLLVTMQNQSLAEAKLNTLFSSAAGAPTPTSQSLFQQLAGQMSSSMRSGIRLPVTGGLTLPDGSAPQATNPLYALLWQEFPVGGFAKNDSYTIALSNPDSSQTWIKPNASYTLTKASLAGYYGLTQSSVVQPGNPQPIALTQVGPQSFAFQSAIVWTPQSGGALSLRPFPPSLERLQLAQGKAPIALSVKSRSADGPYLPNGTPVAGTEMSFVTSVGLTVRQIPSGAPGAFLKDLFALSGASQSDEALLGRILEDLRAGDRPIASIEILYQSAAGASGLNSAAIDPASVFVLRTNTTSVSQPPQLTATLAAGAVPDGVAVGANADLTTDGGYSFLQIVQQATVTNAAGYYLRYVDTAGQFLPAALFQKGVGQITLLLRYKAETLTSPPSVRSYQNAVVLSDAQPSLVYYAETTAPALAIRYAAASAGTFGVTLSRSASATQLTANQAVAAHANLGAEGLLARRDAIAALRASGLTHDAELHAALQEMGAAPAALNALYSLVTFQIEASTGFAGSNLSAPIQPQRPKQGDPFSDYRVVAPLYSVALANQGAVYPNRYASIADPFTFDFFTNDAFGNQLPTPSRYSDTNLYFDPIIPVDQWTGVIASYDFSGTGGPAPGVVALSLTPTASAFLGMSEAELEATTAHFQTIQDQITGPGVSFYVETSLAIEENGDLVPFALSPADTAKINAMIAALLAWLVDPAKPFPTAVTISQKVSGPGTLPPVFPLAVLFGIQRDPALISPYITDSGTILLPSAQNVAANVAPKTGNSGNLSAFAAAFVTAFPAQKLAVGLTGTDTAQPPALKSSTARARSNLRSQNLATDGSGGASTSGAQTLWAAQAAMLDVSIGKSAGSGPRYLSPMPLSNVLNSATVPLPTLTPPLPQLPTQRLFVDIDLDQLNRGFFQAVDTILGPVPAAQAFEQAPAAYAAIARGREAIAQEYSTYEVDWLFDGKSPFSGTSTQRDTAREVFAAQMRAALMSAYSIDTIVQYDVAWNSAVSAAADNVIELFGQVEAIIAGSYDWTNGQVTATSASAPSLSVGDRVLMVFTAGAGSSAPPDGVYTVTGTTGGQFTIDAAGSGGAGTFSATQQNSGLSTAHVAVASSGTSPLTFLYGSQNVASRSVVSMDLRYNVTNLQYFLAPPGAKGEARPSLWLQLIDPYGTAQIPHIGPAGTVTDIPVVFRQYPTSPTLVRQGWAMPANAATTANPIAANSQWDYVYVYQAFLAAQDQINSAITYNTNLSASSPPHAALSAEADGVTVYTLFEALARASSVIDALRPILQDPTKPDWAGAVTAFAQSVTEVTGNSDWSPSGLTAAVGQLNQITDQYVIKDDTAGGTQTITLSWEPAQGQSHYAGVTLSLSALDPTSATLQPYPNQTSSAVQDGLQVTVLDAPPGGLGVVQQITVNDLNVLAAENALASVQVERNDIELQGAGQNWQVLPTFVYKTALVRASQPVTPFIDVAAPIDTTTLPSLGSGPSCPSASASSLCQRIYTIMANLLADPDQSAALLGALRAAGSTAPDTVRRMKMGCSFAFPMPAVSGTPYDQASLSPLVPVVMARSFDIDAQNPAQLGDFALLFAQAIAVWASQNAITFGSGSEPAGAQLVFDATLYAALSGVDTPVLRFTSLTLNLTDIDPA